MVERLEVEGGEEGGKPIAVESGLVNGITGTDLDNDLRVGVYYC